jgi:hypothetical protein
MPENKKIEQAERRRLRYAERKLSEAKLSSARAERGILYWSRILADLRHKRTRAIQPPLWPEEDTKKKMS